MPTEVPDKAAALLTSEPLIAHLATCHDDRPHVAPIWYNYRDGAIEIVTTGRKLANIRRNPRVALSVQKAEDGHAQWAVTVRGTATVIEGEAEGKEMMRRINRRYDAEDDAWSENTPVRIDVGSVDHWGY
jgi:PPOX class probable F420-dependent enzyme